MIIYRYNLQGTAADEQTWDTIGTVEIDKPGEFLKLPHLAMAASFQQLTKGDAVYGKPGIGCNGPYRCTRMLIEELKQ